MRWRSGRLKDVSGISWQEVMWSFQHCSFHEAERPDYSRAKSLFLCRCSWGWQEESHLRMHALGSAQAQGPAIPWPYTCPCALEHLGRVAQVLGVYAILRLIWLPWGSGMYLPGFSVRVYTCCHDMGGERSRPVLGEHSCVFCLPAFQRSWC